MIVVALARITPFSFDSPIFAGQSAQVACFITSGDPPFHISWNFNGHESNVLSQFGINVVNAGKISSILMIESTTSEHQGNYTCSVKNPAGIVNYTTILHINGKKYCKILKHIS